MTDSHASPATREAAVKTSAWLLYTLIVLEILFMVSPFAAYYYSIYAAPLNALQASPYTAWLTMYLLPHFSYSGCWFANALILSSWPLMLVGIVLFVLGFCQVYWSKFTGQGAVEVGLYRYIRHPQYLALAIIGLGASLYWSRFIVVIALVSMLCIYYFLARVEERLCLDKFGQSYRDYMDRTGMFLPRSWEAAWRSPLLRLPGEKRKRRAVLVALYACVLALTIGSAHLLRGHVIDSLLIDDGEARLTVYLAPVSAPARGKIARLLDDAAMPGNIAYVAPAAWRVPELGFTPTDDVEPGVEVNELRHPGSHGNSPIFAEDRFSVLLAESLPGTGERGGIERLSRALGIRPIQLAELDLTAAEILEIRPASASPWSGVPVPTF
jgi:protein-S-isoprenylcysteine O-methyltransferase Ste14